MNLSRPLSAIAVKFFRNTIHDPKGGFMLRTLFVYILSNRTRRLYVGVTNNLIRRLAEHRSGVKSVFAHHYNIHRLVYFETIAGARAAIAREKQIKGWRREKKVALIQESNPDWEDLSVGW